MSRPYTYPVCCPLVLECLLDIIQRFPCIALRTIARPSVGTDTDSESTRVSVILMNLSNDVIRENLSCWERERSNNLSPWLYTKKTLQPVLFATCLISRTWNDVSTRPLYRDVLLACKSKLWLPYDALDRKEFLLHARSLLFPSAFSGRLDENEDVGDYEVVYLERLYRICPRIFDLWIHSNHGPNLHLEN